ncbi:MAG: hemolysin XhlA family protein [Peptostreptococcaceae bacterium]|nr:hemolysin XhlA family protein [Peptostreptococcaceae bacterium]
MEHLKELCEERHHHVQDRLSRNESRLNNHSKRIDAVEQNFTRMDERIGGLITEMSKLNSILRWLFGLAATALVGFLFRAIEKVVM